jgi:hypothetical protein
MGGGMRKVDVNVTLGKEELMRAVREMTINLDSFNSDYWSLWDVEVFEAAACLIRREIGEKARAKLRMY